MNYIERKEQILTYLNMHNGISKIEPLCKNLFSSRSTIRRDLILLEEEGMVTRHHGSVSLVRGSASETSVMMRKMENLEKKSCIAKIAQKYLKDNMVLFLDSSSTVSYLVPKIKTFKEMTIITNGINIVTQLNNSPDAKCYLCPGLLKRQSLSIIGEHSVSFLNNFNAQIAFLSCKAVNSRGIFEGDDGQAMIKKTMMKNAAVKILLCDNSKEFASGYFKLANFKDFDYIVSNAPFTPELMNAITASGCTFICQEK